MLHGLPIHCQSKDYDLGTFVYSTPGNPLRGLLNPINSDTVQYSFFCKIEWLSMTIIFDIYKEGRYLYGCHQENCYWDINSKGACLLKNGSSS